MEKGILLITIARISSLASGYAIHFFLGQHLGPHPYGIVGVIFALTAIVQVFVNSPRHAIAKYTAEYGWLAFAIRRKALQMQAAFSSVVCGLVILLAEPIATVLHDSDLIPYLRIGAFIIPITAIFYTYLASLNGLRQFNKQAGAIIIHSASRTFLVWLLVFVGLGARGAILGLLVGSLCALLIVQGLCKGQIAVGNFPTSQLIRFTIPTTLSSVGLILLMNIDSLFFKSLVHDNTLVGYYICAATIARMPYYVILALVDTLLPLTAEAIGRKNQEDAQKYISKALRYMLILLVPGSSMVSMTAGGLIPLLYSSAYIKAALPLAILIWGWTFLAFFVALAVLITAEGKPAVIARISFPLVLFDALLNWVLIPRYQLIGAAVATTITMLIGAGLMAYYVLKDFCALIEPLSLAKILVASLIILLFAAIYSVKGLWLLAHYAGLWGLYLALLMGLKEIREEDIQVMKGIFHIFRRER
jgi:stage V sporulation protein B